MEKPDPAQARSLFVAGALWNTMIMVFRVETLLRHVDTLFPEVAKHFRSFATSIGTPAEKSRTAKSIAAYHRSISPKTLEKISAGFSGTVSVLPVLQMTWSDWESPQRHTGTKRTIKRRIHWVKQPQPLTFSAPGATPTKTAEVMLPPRQGGLVVNSTG